ncbi:hypothetical protein FT662_04394 [Candidozyma haemuli var. vulneris]|uniref:Major facilitator superfamily (MFS) profile domain-containing protein n=1 Tax=Candidozyma haemuli TaxID=45357 RepID=A0A2V1AM94_9ASCO|nr:hypothetical protein CXQ85_001313 [[Candida] haemuloni]KAF3986736.1 hypothetical protein FT662_04394 [[Candida] haemuloni var. vulneris]PVH19019.1 hypothetical protein CXQ85_001313 [[Candida] haemuloni]
MSTEIELETYAKPEAPVNVVTVDRTASRAQTSGQGQSSSQAVEETLNPVTSFSPTGTPLQVDEQENVFANMKPQPNDLFPDGGLKAWSVVLGSFIGLVINFGFLNAVGAIQAYVSNHQLAGEPVSSVSWVFSIYMCLPFFLGAFVGPIFDTKGATPLLIAATVLLFGGFIAVSFSNSIVAFIFSLAICMGSAQALAITPLVSSVSHWFMLNRGKAMGVATLGGSIGGIIWPIVLNALYGSVGFGWGIRICGFICLAGSISSVLLVKSRFKRSLSEPDSDHLGKHKRLLSTTKSFFDLSAFKDMKFSFLVGGVFSTEIALMSILTYLATYAMSYGLSEQASLYLLTFFNLAGAFGRYIPNHLADKIGTFNVMVLMLIGFVISIFCIWLPAGHTRAGLYVFTVACGFFSSSILGLTPLCLGSISQVDKFGQRYGLMYTFASTGILFGVPVGAALIGDGSPDEYRNFIIFCGVFAFVGTISWIVSRWYIVGFKINIKV